MTVDQEHADEGARVANICELVEYISLLERMQRNHIGPIFDVSGARLQPLHCMEPALASAILLVSMQASLRLSLVAWVTFCLGHLASPESFSAVATPVLKVNVPTFTGAFPISEEATCGDWTSWVPPRADPALVMQIVSEDYVDVERNFIRLMELNSIFTRHHLYLMCMDDASVRIFASLGIRCVPLGMILFDTIHDLWKTRIRALSCLVMGGYDVIMSDADALWLGDPMEYFSLPSVRSSGVAASRGRMPLNLSSRWGATVCLGFILFRATGPGMDMLQRSMEEFVLRIGDDQIATNKAFDQLGVVWDEGSDMRLYNSTGLGKGTIDSLHGEDGPFVISLLPHSAFTRRCDSTPISNATVVAHCHSTKTVRNRSSWMQEANLWLVDSSDP